MRNMDRLSSPKSNYSFYFRCASVLIAGAGAALMLATLFMTQPLAYGIAGFSLLLGGCLSFGIFSRKKNQVSALAEPGVSSRL